MNFTALQLTLGTLLTSCLLAVEPGFVPLLDRDHADGWMQCGPGQMTASNGVFTTSCPVGSKPNWGCTWYSKRMFADFVLKLEFKGGQREFNSGVWLRFADPQGSIMRLHDQKYEVAIRHDVADDKWPTGSIHANKKAMMRAMKADDWNEFEITVVGQRYTVRLNGQAVNDFTGSKNTAGYIGLEENNEGPVQFRNVRIKDLSAPWAAIAPAALQSNPNQARIDVLKDQATNAMEWALSPLDQTLSPDIRQNLTLLREDLLDEARLKPKGNANAYSLGFQLCDKILAAITERSQSSVRAGYTAAQANADIRVDSQSLRTNRNYMMRWPQYAREKDERSELQRQQFNEADLKRERSKVDWANRSDILRKYLDDLYRQFREALR